MLLLTSAGCVGRSI